MAVQRTITRYFLIINMVRQPGYPGFSDIRDTLKDHDFSITDRTIQRDLKYIREELGIKIEYNDYHRGYYIDSESSPGMDSLLKFLEMAVITGTFNEIYADSDKASDLVSFDGEGLVKGVEFISTLLFALTNRQKVKITYQRFIDSRPFPVIVMPALLKEYQNRWYLVGLVNKDEEIRSYALDRTKNVELLSEFFSREKVRNVRASYNNLIGLSHAGGKPCLIKFEVEADQAKYIETLPWHNTQEVESRNDRSVIFSLYVVPNFELQQKILSLGKAVLNIEPDSLKKAIEENK